MKLKIIGDSIMKGVCLSKNQRYTLRDDSDFKKKAAERGIDVEKHCRLGATVEYGNNEIRKALDGADDDTLVLFGFGGNDSDYDWREVAAAPDEEHIPHTAPEKFKKLYGDAIEYAKGLGAKVAVVTLVPVNAMRYFLKISELVYYGNVIKWLGDINRIARWQNYYNDLVLEVAKEHGCDVIDLRTPFMKSKDLSELICDDGLHPTETGYKIIDDTIIGALDEMKAN